MCLFKHDIYGHISHKASVVRTDLVVVVGHNGLGLHTHGRSGNWSHTSGTSSMLQSLQASVAADK